MKLFKTGAEKINAIDNALIRVSKFSAQIKPLFNQ